MKVAHRISPNSITVVVGGRVRVVAGSSPNFERLREELRKPEHDLEVIRECADISSFVARATFGAVQIGDDAVRWNGTKLHHVIADRLIAMLKAGDDLEPLALFLSRLMENPLETARNELYQWLEAGDAPITPEGRFLAYKAVRSNFTDKRTGTMDNSVGAVVEMKRSDVDPDRNNECSRGLHFCQQGYLKSFAGTGDPIMIVEVDPADVVAIPRDYQHQKGRAWRYRVIDQVPPEEVPATFFGGKLVERRYSEPHQISEPEASSASARVNVRGDLLERGFINVTSPWDMKRDTFLTYINPKGELRQVKFQDFIESSDYDEVVVFYRDREGIEKGYINDWQSNLFIDLNEVDAPAVPAVSLDALDNAGVDKAGQLNKAMKATPLFITEECAPRWLPEGPVEKIARALDANPPQGEKRLGSPVKPAPASTPTLGGTVFKTTDGRSFSAKEIRKVAAEKGQRGGAAFLGISKSTFQGWLKKIES